MSVPSPIALLFFPIDLFVPVASPMGLCVCTFSGYSIVLSGRSICACRWVCAFYGWSVVLSVGVIFFRLGLFVFALPSIVSAFLFLVGLFVFQMGGLVTPMGMCIFHGEYVTSWVFKKRECIVRSFS